MNAPVAIVYHDEMLQHQPPGLEPEMRDYHARQLRARLGELVASQIWRHPERPERLSSLVELAREVDDGRPLWLLPERADEATVRRVHTGGHMERLDKLRGRKRMLSIDSTAVSPGSVDAAFRAAGAVCTAVDAVFDGRAATAFALVRPPGHHANAAHYQGFCLINNVAVAARHAMAVHGAERVLIVDWDVHHGNGTASIFADDPDVLFFDIHRASPCYPGSGALEDVGRGRARGTTLNVPLPAETGDLAVLEAFERILVPAARRFRPDLIMVSAGFDGTSEHLACKFSRALYAHLTDRLQKLTDELCNGRLVLALEGGYHLEPMREALAHCLRMLRDPGCELPPLQRSRIGLPAVREAADFLARQSSLLRD
ncbi:histone deacetylase family protein [Wenzhouxiangella sp. EGI_FJ10305]|uniref:histone deacetylase family protein n=1 Tax=Wenzhouxiangella sp. EGI_FJ10305 TaxID=3243768 RepID=UPI0035DC013B